MNMNDFQQAAWRTSNKEVGAMAGLMVAALGLAGEAGEVADHVKKWVGHGHPIDKEKVKKELGDVLYYVADAATRMGLTLEEVAQGNVDKLLARYPNGFSAEASINRTDE